MGKDYGNCGSWQWHNVYQSPNLNCEDLGRRNVACNPLAYSSYANHCSVSVNGSAAGFPVPPDYGLESLCANYAQAWYSFHRQQSLSQSPVLTEKLYVPYCCGEAAPNQKQLLIVDQSGSHTSLIFSSPGYPLQNPFLSNLKSSEANVTNVAQPINKDTPVVNLEEKLLGWNELDEIHETSASGGSESEMHEDTDELNALLYSDDENEEEEEEDSTGHSPSEVMTGSEKNKGVGSNDDEVASSVTPPKRRRLEADDDLALTDTASSGKESYNVDEDVESSCVKGGFTEGSSASKRVKREKIRQTVDILRSIIPGGTDKEAIVVIDETIQYLKSMRMKAEALGAAALR